MNEKTPVDVLAAMRGALSYMDEHSSEYDTHNADAYLDEAIPRFAELLEAAKDVARMYPGTPSDEKARRLTRLDAAIKNCTAPAT